MVYSVSMVHPYIMILFISSVFSSKSSSLVDNSITNPFNLTITPSVFVGKYKTEIKLDKYLHAFDLKNLLEALGKNYSQIVRYAKIGQSAIYSIPIWGVQISRNVQQKRKLLKPMFKFVANVHGDETVGYALMVSLIQYLVYSDGDDEDVTRLLNTTDIWIVPTLNPDRLFGYFGNSNASDRILTPPINSLNENRVNIDDDFPDIYLKYNWPYQEETQSMLDFMEKNSFVLSGNLQGNAIVASYPYDTDEKWSKENGVGNLTPDDAVFKKLAKDYAQRNQMMKNGNSCDGKTCVKSFPNGIANGNIWNKKFGSMQDANYRFFNCFEITLHVSCFKWAPPSELPMYWAANLPSMLYFIDSIHQGIYGLVKDKEGNPIKGARVNVKGINKYVKTTEEGEYWRLLVPSYHSYVVTVRAPPTFIEETKSVHLTLDDSYVKLDFVLARHSFYGTVVNKDNGKPVKEAFIKAFPEGGGKYGNYIDIKVHDGKFGMSLSPGEYDLRITAPGYTQDRTTVIITEQEPVQRHFNLNREGVFGNVTDQNGNIIKGANILLSINGKKANGETPKAKLFSTTRSVVKRIRVDENGEYWLRLGEGSYTIHPDAPGCSSEGKKVNLNRTQNSICHNFRITRHENWVRRVHGSITDRSGIPVKGAVVRILGRYENIVLRSHGSRGWYETALYPGTYNLFASAPGYSTMKKKIHIDHSFHDIISFNLWPE